MSGIIQGGPPIQQNAISATPSTINQQNVAEQQAKQRELEKKADEQLKATQQIADTNDEALKVQKQQVEVQKQQVEVQKQQVEVQKQQVQVEKQQVEAEKQQVDNQQQQQKQQEKAQKKQASTFADVLKANREIAGSLANVIKAIGENDKDFASKNGRALKEASKALKKFTENTESAGDHEISWLNFFSKKTRNKIFEQADKNVEDKSLLAKFLRARSESNRRKATEQLQSAIKTTTELLVKRGEIKDEQQKLNIDQPTLKKIEKAITDANKDALSVQPNKPIFSIKDSVAELNKNIEKNLDVMSNNNEKQLTVVEDVSDNVNELTENSKKLVMGISAFLNPKRLDADLEAKHDQNVMQQASSSMLVDIRNDLKTVIGLLGKMSGANTGRGGLFGMLAGGTLIIGGLLTKIVGGIAKFGLPLIFKGLTKIGKWVAPFLLKAGKGLFSWVGGHLKNVLAPIIDRIGPAISAVLAKVPGLGKIFAPKPVKNAAQLSMEKYGFRKPTTSTPPLSTTTVPPKITTGPTVATGSKINGGLGPLAGKAPSISKSGANIFNSIKGRATQLGQGAINIAKGSTALKYLGKGIGNASRGIPFLNTAFSAMEGYYDHSNRQQQLTSQLANGTITQQMYDQYSRENDIRSGGETIAPLIGGVVGGLFGPLGAAAGSIVGELAREKIGDAAVASMKIYDGAKQKLQDGWDAVTKWWNKDEKEFQDKAQQQTLQSQSSNNAVVNNVYNTTNNNNSSANDRRSYSPTAFEGDPFFRNILRGDGINPGSAPITSFSSF